MSATRGRADGVVREVPLGLKNSKSFVLIRFHSYTEPTMSPMIAPHMAILRVGVDFSAPAEVLSRGPAPR